MPKCYMLEAIALQDGPDKNAPMEKLEEGAAAYFTTLSSALGSVLEADMPLIASAANILLQMTTVTHPNDLKLANVVAYRTMQSRELVLGPVIPVQRE